MTNNQLSIINHQSKAFTLVEILVVMLISSVIVLGTAGTFKQAYRVWAPLEKRRPLQTFANDLVDVLRMELAGAYMPSVIDANHPTWILSSDGENLEEFSFLTTTPCWHNSPIKARPARVTYTLKANDRNDNYSLLRTEQAYAGAKPIGEPRQDILMENLGRLTVQTPEAKDKTQDEGEGIPLDEQGMLSVMPGTLQIGIQWPAGAGVNIDAYETILPVGGQISSGMTNLSSEEQED